jgi:hypothetical protein
MGASEKCKLLGFLGKPVVWRIGNDATNMLQFGNQLVHSGQEIVAAGMRKIVDQRRRMLGQFLCLGLARPAPNLAVGQQGKPPQVTFPAREPQVAQDVFESILKG